MSKLEIGTIATLLVLGLMALFPAMFIIHPLNDTAGLPLAPPDWQHLLGTDAFGRDVWTQLVYATRYSLIVGLLATGIAVVLGVSVGLLAGSARGWMDDAFMRLADLFDSVPGLLLALFLVTLWGPGVVQLSIALGLAGWSGRARLARATAVGS